MSSDGGALLLERTNRRLKLLGGAAACFQDHRKPWLVKHQVEERIAQRVYGLALGYEDLSDHDQLRQDPLLALLSGKPQVGEEPLAGKSTLNRLELSTAKPNRYKKISCRPEALDELLTAVLVEAHPKAPEQIVLDLDVTCFVGPSRGDGPSAGCRFARLQPRQTLFVRSDLSFSCFRSLSDSV
jgi:hypothetical protein